MIRTCCLKPKTPPPLCPLCGWMLVKIDGKESCSNKKCKPKEPEAKPS